MRFMIGDSYLSEAGSLRAHLRDGNHRSTGRQCEFALKTGVSSTLAEAGGQNEAVTLPIVPFNLNEGGSTSPKRLAHRFDPLRGL